MYNFGQGLTDAAQRGANFSPSSLGLKPGGVGQALRLQTSDISCTTGDLVEGISKGITLVMIAEHLGASGANNFIFGESAPGTGAYNVGFYETTGDELRFFVHNGSTGVNAQATGDWPGARSTQVWIGTFGDGDNNVRIYLDGRQRASAAQTGNIQRNTAAHLSICRWNTSGTNMLLYAAAVLPRRLSAREVAERFHSPVAAWNALHELRSSGPPALASSSIDLVAASTTATQASAALATAITAAASSSTAPTVTAALGTAINLSVAPSSAPATTVGLSTAIPLQIAASSASTVTATLTAPGAGMQAVASASPGCTATLSTAIPLQAAASSSPTTTATLTAPGAGLQMQSSASPAASASLSTSIHLAAAASASPAVTAQLTATAAAWSVLAIAQAQASAALSTAIRLQAAPSTRPTVAADLDTGNLFSAPSRQRIGASLQAPASQRLGGATPTVPGRRIGPAVH